MQECALYLGNNKMVEWLINHGADVNQANDQFVDAISINFHDMILTPLHVAAKMGKCFPLQVSFFFVEDHYKSLQF